MRVLLLLDFGDGFDPTLFRGGEGHPIAGMQLVQRQAVLCLELFGRAARAGPDGAALRLANGNRVIDPVNFRNRTVEHLFGQGRRSDDGEDASSSQNDLCDFHGGLPVFER